jgi:hypothetical protein
LAAATVANYDRCVKPAPFWSRFGAERPIRFACETNGFALAFCKALKS